jgi:hypothetical protein
MVNANLTGANLKDTRFHDSDLVSTKMTDAALENTLFKRTVFLKSAVGGVNFKNCRYVGHNGTEIPLNGRVVMLNEEEDPWPIMMAEDGMAICEIVGDYDYWFNMSQRAAIGIGGKLAGEYRTGRYQQVLDRADQEFNVRARLNIGGNPNG